MEPTSGRRGSSQLGLLYSANRHVLCTLGSVFVAAFMLAWPAFINGYPLLNPDSITYLASGKWVLFALHYPLGHYMPELRSEFYGLGLYLLGWDRWLWPVVAFNALLNATMLWELVRHTAPRPSCVAFLLLTAFLSIATGIGWPISSVMADSYGVPVYFALFLLIVRSESMGQRERWLLGAVAWWGLVAHPTHWVISAGVCAILALLSLTPWSALRSHRRRIGLVAALIAFAVLSQVLLHRFLYGKASLNGPAAPYLMARVLADGTGRRYLQEHCGTQHWVICKHVDAFPNNPDDFLWSGDGIWGTASTTDREALRREEGPFVLATIRAYPGAQLHQSWRNFRQQMATFSVYGVAANASWIGEHLAAVVPHGAAPYKRSRQNQGRLPVQWTSLMQGTTVDCSVVALVVLIPLAWLRRRRTMQALSVVVVSVILLNAATCAILSNITDRYMARVIWLLPMLAVMLARDLFQLRPLDHEETRAAPKPRAMVHRIETVTATQTVYARWAQTGTALASEDAIVHFSDEK